MVVPAAVIVVVVIAAVDGVDFMIATMSRAYNGRILAIITFVFCSSIMSLTLFSPQARMN